MQGGDVRPVLTLIDALAVGVAGAFGLATVEIVVAGVRADALDPLAPEVATLAMKAHHDIPLSRAELSTKIAEGDQQAREQRTFLLEAAHPVQTDEPAPAPPATPSLVQAKD